MVNITKLRETCERVNINCLECNVTEDCKELEMVVNDINYLYQKDIGIIPCNWNKEEVDLIEEELEN